MPKVFELCKHFSTPNELPMPSWVDKSRRKDAGEVEVGAYQKNEGGSDPGFLITRAWLFI